MSPSFPFTLTIVTRDMSLGSYATFLSKPLMELWYAITHDYIVPFDDGFVLDSESSDIFEDNIDLSQKNTETISEDTNGQLPLRLTFRKSSAWDNISSLKNSRTSRRRLVEVTPSCNILMWNMLNPSHIVVNRAKILSECKVICSSADSFSFYSEDIPKHLILFRQATSTNSIRRRKVFVGNFIAIGHSTSLSKSKSPTTILTIPKDSIKYHSDTTLRSSEKDDWRSAIGFLQKRLDTALSHANVTFEDFVGNIIDLESFSEILSQVKDSQRLGTSSIPLHRIVLAVQPLSFPSLVQFYRVRTVEYKKSRSIKMVNDAWSDYNAIEECKKCEYLNSSSVSTTEGCFHNSESKSIGVKRRRISTFPSTGLPENFILPPTETWEWLHPCVLGRQFLSSSTKYENKTNTDNQVTIGVIVIMLDVLLKDFLFSDQNLELESNMDAREHTVMWDIQDSRYPECIANFLNQKLAERTKSLSKSQESCPFRIVWFSHMPFLHHASMATVSCVLSKIAMLWELYFSDFSVDVILSIVSNAMINLPVDSNQSPLQEDMIHWGNGLENTISHNAYQSEGENLLPSKLMNHNFPISVSNRYAYYALPEIGMWEIWKKHYNSHHHIDADISFLIGSSPSKKIIDIPIEAKYGQNAIFSGELWNIKYMLQKSFADNCKLHYVTKEELLEGESF